MSPISAALIQILNNALDLNNNLNYRDADIFQYFVIF